MTEKFKKLSKELSDLELIYRIENQHEFVKEAVDAAIEETKTRKLKNEDELNKIQDAKPSDYQFGQDYANEQERLEAEELESKFNGQFVGFGYRFLAYLIDTVVCYLTIAFIAGYIFTYFIIIEDLSISLIVNLMSLSVWWLYYSLWESSNYQATIGKLIIGVKVIDYNGEKINFKKASKRYFARILSVLIFGIGYLMIFTNYKKQTLHDRIAGTYIIEKTRQHNNN